MIVRSLCGERWTLRALGIPKGNETIDIPATVPGCVHTDLLVAGLIPDPYVGTNEEQVQWIGETDWRYQASFAVDEEILACDRVELVCEGLDTVCRLNLNGRAIGRAENMHVPHRFDAKADLRPGGNHLAVTFQSAIVYSNQMRGPNKLPRGYFHDYNFIRKMACNFGWDWGPVLVTAGIWQPIALVGWDTARIDSLRPMVLRAEPEGADVELHVAIAYAGISAEAPPLVLVARLTDPEGYTIEVEQPIAEPGNVQVIPLAVPEPRLWWPRGYGGQPLYGVRVELRRADGTTLDVWDDRIGLRTVQLNTDPDEIGAHFAIEVNGKPVFCKGANWIPDDCFVTRIDAARYRERIGQAIAANMNMLRVWAGGLYETEDFYRICDELGVLVWQDFLFACAAYPEAEPFLSLVREEARYQVSRLSRHPSLVLWCGNNENIWGFFDWGWQDMLAGRAWGLGYYLDMLPAIVKELDPTRPYWPGSPYSGSMGIHPLDDRYGNMHIWDAWNQDYVVYRKHRPRFATEFGFQGPPAWSTLARAIPDEERKLGSAAMLAHEKAGPGFDHIASWIAAHFGEVPEDFDDWFYLAQLNQARALIVGVEWFRSNHPRCMGILYWQINDCWPVMSWSSVDGDGRLKPLWHATRRFFADRFLTIQPLDPSVPEGTEQVALFAHNDTGDPWRAEIALRRLTFAGEERAAVPIAIDLAPRASACIDLPPEIARADDPSGELIVADGDDSRAYWYFRRDRELAYPEPAFDAALDSADGVHRLTVRANSLLRDVILYPDRLDPAATVDDQLVTILPGESHAFVIRSERAFDREELVRSPVFRCANEFGRKLD